MRMEELSDNRYIKGVDTVERYLLNLVQDYFKNFDTASTTSREYIIEKALERMKEEITFDSIGVLSITLPDGEMKTGAVSITLEDLNGEPIISPKMSAFNVNFGTDSKTACEGNDPRLSDARKPLEHQHKISDIIGLEGILSTISGKVERMDGFLHEHSNKNVLDILVYTGNNSTIDLTILETLENKVIKITDEIRENIIEFTKETNDKITVINQKVSEIDTKVTETRQYALDTNKEYYNLSKKYTDEYISKTQEEIEAEFDKLVTKDILGEIFEIASNVYTLVGSMEFDLNDKLDFTNEVKQQSVSIDIDPDILSELLARGQKLKDCQIETIIQYKELTTNKMVNGVLPYIMFNDNIVDGSIQLSTVYTYNKILLSLDSVSFNIPDEIKDARIIYKVYSKQKITLT